ncbi:hypothetical protein DFS34DRAFT_652585 [Phlyctochytrium arcticum]|nr:hypothetical protein DFS34DRAFT_652585 [Phlyctochytrium arcticum]
MMPPLVAPRSILGMGQLQGSTIQLAIEAEPTQLAIEATSAQQANKGVKRQGFNKDGTPRKKRVVKAKATEDRKGKGKASVDSVDYGDNGDDDGGNDDIE